MKPGKAAAWRVANISLIFTTAGLALNAFDSVLWGTVLLIAGALVLIIGVAVVQGKGEHEK